MSWNYRVCHRPSVPGSGYQIHEVYYEDNGDIKLYSSKPISAHGDISEELYQDLCWMMDAFDKDPLNLDMVDRMFAESKTKEG